MMNISNSVSGCSQESFAAVLRRIPSACSLRTRMTTSTGRDTAQPHATPNTRPTRGPAGTAAAPNRVRASQAFRTESVWTDKTHSMQRSSDSQRMEVYLSSLYLLTAVRKPKTHSTVSYI